MAKIYLGDTEISSSGGTTYDDTSISNRVSALEGQLPTYISKADYEALVSAGTVEEDKYYVISDLVDTTEIADFATQTDVSNAITSAVSQINDAKNWCPVAVMTEAQYNALTTIDSSVLYVLT